MLEFHGVVSYPDYATAITALAEVGFIPLGRNLPPQPFRLPFDWHADPLRDGNWMFQLHAWRLLDPHFHRLLAEPEHPRAFADILEVIADWHRGNIQGDPGPFTWYDMSTGIRALKLALLGHIAASRRYDLDRDLMEDLAARHVAELSRPEALSWNNHGLFQLSGLRALLWQNPRLPGADMAHAYAIDRAAALIDSQFGPQGVHTEHSPDYHFFAVRTVENHLKAPWWQLEDIAALREKLVAAERARYWLVDPLKRCLPVGDSREQIAVEDFGGIRHWAHQHRNDAMGAVLDGYGVVRTDPLVPVERSSMVFLTASFNGQVHKHSDCLSLIWQEAGENLLIDSGKYGYRQDAMRRYFLGTSAHNTVEVDGRSFSRRKEQAYGSGIRTVAPLERSWLIEAEARHGAEGILHRRTVLFRPHHFLLAVDRVEADQPRRRSFTVWWHFNPDHVVEEETGGRGGHVVTGLASGKRLFVTHVGNGPGTRVELHRGTMEPRVQGWISRGYLKCEPASALGFSGRSDADFVAATLFELASPAASRRIGLGRTPSGRLTLTDASGEGPPGGGRSFELGDVVLDVPRRLL